MNTHGTKPCVRFLTFAQLDEREVLIAHTSSKEGDTDTDDNDRVFTSTTQRDTKAKVGGREGRYVEEGKYEL